MREWLSAAVLAVSLALSIGAEAAPTVRGAPPVRGAQTARAATPLPSPSPQPTPTLDLSFDTVRDAPTWNNFSAVMTQQEEKDHIEGLSYMISGGVAIAGGLIGYYSSDDVFAKAVYSLAQTVGIGAVGFGAYKYTLGDEHSNFYQTIRDTRSLSPQQRDSLVMTYFNLEKSRDRHTRTIKAITHGLVALLNGYNAATSSQQDLRTALFFVAGVNLLASVSFAF